MTVGLIFATLAGFCLPAWLVLLARSLDSFSAIAKLIGAGAGDEAYDELRSTLEELCIAFGGLGACSLVVGFAYVSSWTYTGDEQAIRIKKSFVQSALRQDAEWFDVNNREELPTSIANDDPNCRVSGADVMCCIYGVILCATFFWLTALGLQSVNLSRQAAA